uniref:Cytochrome c oxidase assembly factor 3 mitochondrial coiled-coil domain-containing protein n=1 Tax=Amphimedon queenslandica TaxID=400682 RepID=A0A1X7VFH9_AMPQE
MESGKVKNPAADAAKRDEAIRREIVKEVIRRRYGKRNTVVGLGLAAGVLGIYAYSMFAVKQENFLDEEFDKPGAGSYFDHTLLKSCIMNRGPSPPVSGTPFFNLLIYSLMMIVLPIGGFFSSKYFIFEVLLGYSDGSVGAAIVAVILVHIVIGLYVYAAWKEGPTKTD